METRPTSMSLLRLCCFSRSPDRAVIGRTGHGLETGQSEAMEKGEESRSKCEHRLDDPRRCQKGPRVARAIVRQGAQIETVHERGWIDGIAADHDARREIAVLVVRGVCACIAIV